jgi:serine/threonine protein kinase
MANLVGKDLGRYHLVEQLGEGGMAAVYKAYDRRLDRYVAIKVIISGQQDSKEFLKRFHREAQALAKLSHTNIVKVYDYGDENGLPYLVMEYLPGGTLKNQMTGKPMPYLEAARLLAPVARALESSHQMDIIHRDVKPANILFNPSGQPMLSDFGIAKMLTSDESTALTGMGVGIGTPEYMAPEQGQGLPIDSRADIYALGVVLYELVTGRKPFRADTPMAVIVKHMTEPLPRPRSFAVAIPEEVESIIFKAMAKDPKMRYQTMGEFAAALEALYHKSAVLQQPVSPAEARTLTQADSRPSTPLKGTAAVPDVAGYGAQPVPQAAARRSNPALKWILLVGGLLAGVVLLVLCIGGGFLIFNQNRTTPTSVAQASQELPAPSQTATVAGLEPTATQKLEDNATAVETTAPASTATPTRPAGPSETPGIPTEVPTDIPIIDSHGEITLTTMNDQSSNQSTIMIQYNTSLSKADAVAFYLKEMAANGWTLEQEMDQSSGSSKTHTMMFQKDGNTARTVMVMVVQTDSMVYIQVIDARDTQ